MSSGSYPTKRVLDIVVLVLVAAPASMVALIAAASVKATSRGPVLFRQNRVAVDGVEFECLKFRTMIVGDNPLIPDASRITSAGKWLRRFSLDELPQLVNVARGEMSIVGPRPMLPFQYERCDDRQRRRFSIKPGLTGWAQVNGRNGLTWSERVALDLVYVDRQSALFDVQIMLKTSGALLAGSGVAGHDPNDPFVVDSEVKA